MGVVYDGDYGVWERSVEYLGSTDASIGYRRWEFCMSPSLLQEGQDWEKAYVRQASIFCACLVYE
jgi:hypothetical protein